MFNFAQGAIGMFLAFVYWQLRVDIGLPTIVGILLTVLIAAPLMGVLIERLIMRFLTDSPIVAQLVVTIGLMLGLMGLAGSIWNPNSNTQRVIPTFFGISGFSLGGTFMPYYRVVTIATGIAIGLLLRFLLYHTRLGVTMRAVVDNRDLTVLNGARPASATMTAWALGSSMAALAGIFLAEELSALDPSTLTLFIVDAFAAAIIARLRSLPMAYVGGLIIGLTLSFQETFLSWSGRWTSAPQAIPAALLFIAVLFVRDARIKGRSKPRQTAERIPTNRNALLGFGALIVIALICAATLSLPNLREVILIVLTALVMLSLVPLTGWANQISLAQITLVGCGAFAFAEWGFNGNVLGLLVATAFAVPIGLIMAGPAIRLQGIYLALATMAFARLAEFLFFDQPKVFGNGNLQVPNLSVFGLQVENPFSFLGISFAQDSGLLIFVTILFCVVGMIVIMVQRRSFGRRLVALRDSPDAASMLGMSLTLTKLSVFMFSAAIAGLAGGLFAIYYSSVGTTDFQLTVGLPYLLLLVVGGMTTVGGTIIGAIGLVQFAWFNQAFPDNTFLTWFSNLGPGLIGIGVGRNPEGAWEQNVQLVAKLRRRLAGARRRRAVDAGHAHAGRGARGDQAALARAARRHRPPGGRAARRHRPLRRPARGQPGQPRPAGRADHRPHRAERRGQDDAVQRRHRHAGAQRGPDLRRRPGRDRRAAAPVRPARPRPHLPAARGVRVAHRARQHPGGGATAPPSVGADRGRAAPTSSPTRSSSTSACRRSRRPGPSCCRPGPPGWSRWPGRWRPSRGCCCSTSPPRGCRRRRPTRSPPCCAGSPRPASRSWWSSTTWGSS